MINECRTHSRCGCLTVSIAPGAAVYNKPVRRARDKEEKKKSKNYETTATTKTENEKKKNNSNNTEKK